MIFNIKPKAILFDFDDTLVGTKPIIDKALEATFNKFSIDQAILKNIDRNRSLRDYFHEIFDSNLNEAREEYYRNYDKYSSMLAPLEKAVEVLEFLKTKKVYVSVISNKVGHRLRNEIKTKLNWEGYFLNIVGSGDAEEDKPSPKPAQLAINGMNIESLNQVWLVGDSLIDLQTAENFGCQGVLLGNNSFKEKPKIDLTVENHSQLLKIFREIYE